MNRLIRIALSILVLSAVSISQEKIIVDSNLLIEEALSGLDIPQSIRKNLLIGDLKYYSFDGRLHQGQVVIDKKLAQDIKEIFEQIRKEKFPIGKVVPVVQYNWSDEKSMMDNNTSAFNYRVVKGTKVLSAHSIGRAIDINPLLNPQIKKGKVFPKGSIYDIKKPGTISADSFLVKEFRKRGWVWGGRWRSTKDYQHFEKK